MHLIWARRCEQTHKILFGPRIIPMDHKKSLVPSYEEYINLSFHWANRRETGVPVLHVVMKSLGLEFSWVSFARTSKIVCPSTPIYHDPMFYTIKPKLTQFWKETSASMLSLSLWLDTWFNSKPAESIYSHLGVVSCGSSHMSIKNDQKENHVWY